MLSFSCSDQRVYIDIEINFHDKINEGCKYELKVTANFLVNFNWIGMELLSSF